MFFVKVCVSDLFNVQFRRLVSAHLPVLYRYSDSVFEFALQSELQANDLYRQVLLCRNVASAAVTEERVLSPKKQ